MNEEYESVQTVAKISLIKKRIANLISVKSIVTLILTVVFAYMCIINGEINNDFLTIYLTVIAFYFGTQSQKIQDALEVNNEQQ